MLEVRVSATIAAIGRRRWDAVFPGELEGFDYLAAVEAARLPGFQWRYILVLRDGAAIAAASAFITDYALETTFDGPARRAAKALRRVAPGLMTQKLACLGSPCTETAPIGFAPGLTPAEREEALGEIIAVFEDVAAECGCNLFGVKDALAGEDDLWSRAAPGYCAVPGQPVASLEIDFQDVETYLAALSPGARRDMRRKLRSRPGVRIEIRDELGPYRDRAMELYAETLARAPTTFEELTGEFFDGVAARMPGRAFFVMYFVGEDLLAFNLLLSDGEVLLDKFFCMEAARGRAHNLYYLSWFRNIEFCLEAGFKRYQSGQAAIETKVRLGSGLTATSMRFRHRNWALNGLLRLAAPLGLAA